jgi:phenylpyruvate tautomerase PptA (4-oxalocrotonate tautomerase family)
MPIYVCTAALGRLTPVQKTEIAQSITAIYHEVTGAPRYMVQVIFHDVAPGNHYVAGRPAPADQIWFRVDIRGGRTTSRRASCFDMMQDVGRASGAAEDAVWIYLCDIPAANIAEYGRVLPPPPGRRTHGSRRYPMPCGKGSGPWPDKLETLESTGD